MAKRFSGIQDFIQKNRLHVLKDVALFILITILIHIVWRFWQIQFNYAPVRDAMYGLMGIMSAEVYRESVWIISGIYDITSIDESMYIYLPNKNMIYINSGCSGLKQMLQFAILMMVFPGPWMKKLWFIPLGVFIMHLTNLFRVVGLAVVMNNWPQYWDFSHDYFFRPIFYLVIFLLWVFWVEKMKKK